MIKGTISTRKAVPAIQAALPEVLHENKVHLVVEENKIHLKNRVYHLKRHNDKLYIVASGCAPVLLDNLPKT